ncbi:MAG: hypothetical protein JAY68_21055 [Candidatus Thiodiazotropha taylori]|nr:hypothetical protein [Candidatus Thiodiazotropha taylori]MCG7937133.1 hypothetical protein [Candidatus Thiodiazotropha taylori]
MRTLFAPIKPWVDVFGERLMKSVFLVIAILISGCSESVDVEFFNYQDCRKKMTAEYIDQGADQDAADMKSKAYCKQQQAKRQ